ncbi:MinD/ParA family ATP-binding protein [Mycolicibacterium tusciae]|uniref:MinD/ParA family ATP-binding protein n=1 Tax=Mycolicibacterium tusciae TaxID=75922 RepID=UPI00024A4B66|nr:MinD/ParA family protein [Mycolicibacterium tusciae]
MSTPPDFFASNNDDPRPEQHSDAPEERTAEVRQQEGEHRRAPSPTTDTGSQPRPVLPPPPADWGHQAAPSGFSPADDRWGTPAPTPAPSEEARRTSQPGAAPQPDRFPSQPTPPPPPPPAPSSPPAATTPPPATEHAAEILGGAWPGPQQPPSSAPQHAAPEPRHQQPPQQRWTQQAPPNTPQGAPSAPQQPNGGYAAPRRQDPSEQTTVLSASDMAALREKAGQDPGVGDFFGPAGADPAAPQQGWPPAPPQATPPAPPPLFAAALEGGEPFGNGGFVAGQDNSPDFEPNRRLVANRGWRKAVRVMTFGLIKPGPSAKEQHDDEILDRIKGQLTGIYTVAFVNSKGGVGKTTMAVAAGNAIARERGDRVIVVDVDTDLGNLSARFEKNGGPKANIQELALLRDARSYSNVKTFTVQNHDRLEMLASQNDPRSSYRLNSQDFEKVMDILRLHYNIIILDCGTSITSSLFPTIAKQVDCLVVVSSNDAPGLNGAMRTLAWLQSHSFGRLIPRTVVTLNANSGDTPAIDMKAAEGTFREQIQEVVRVPYDRHLHEGGFIEFLRMGKTTRKAVMELAGSIALFFPTRESRHRPEELGSY